MLRRFSFILGMVCVLRFFSPLCMADVTIDDAVSAHTASLNLIHSLSFTIDLSLGGQLHESMEFHSAGDKLRYRNQRVFASDIEKTVRLIDTLVDSKSKEQLWLQGEKPEKIADITIVDQQRFFGTISPITQGDMMTIRSPYFCLMKLRMMASDADLSLSDAIARSRAIVGKDAVDFLGKQIVSDAETIAIRIWQPNGGAKADFKQNSKYFDVYLDPAAGYLARRIVSHNRNIKKESSFSNSMTVTDFYSLGDGVFFPKQVVTEFLDSSGTGSPDTDLKITVRNVKVNENIDEELEFVWPENLVVVRKPAIDNRNDVQIMGKGNTPVHTFENVEEYAEFRNQLKYKPSKPVSALVRARQIAGIVSFVLIAATIGLLLIKRGMATNEK